MIDLRLPTGFPTTSTTRLPPLPSPPCPPPSGPQSGTESTGTSPGPPGGARRPFVAPPVCVGRNVYPAAAAAHALRPLRRHSLSARSFIPWPACARTCWKRVRDCSWQNTTYPVRELQLAHTCGSTSGSARSRTVLNGGSAHAPPTPDLSLSSFYY